MKTTQTIARALAGLILLAALLIALNPRVRAAFESKQAFRAHPDCPTLRLERNLPAPRGACEALAAANEHVSRALGLEIDPPPVYLVSDQDRFGELIGIPGATATGAVFLGQIFLAPRAFSAADWLAILRHELVHHAWRDHLGPWSAQRRHPTWFQEGLAVHVSGGGAERISPRQARAAIADGRTLTPLPRGSLLNPHRPTDDGLSYPMYYRQAALFVAYLAEDVDAFARLLQSLRAGEYLASALKLSHDATIEELWGRFVAETSDKLVERQGPGIVDER